MGTKRNGKPEWLTVAEAVRASGYSFNWVRQLITSGRLEAVKRTGRINQGKRWEWAVSRRALEAYLKGVAQ